MHGDWRRRFKAIEGARWFLREVSGIAWTAPVDPMRELSHGGDQHHLPEFAARLRPSNKHDRPRLRRSARASGFGVGADDKKDHLEVLAAGGLAVAGVSALPAAVLPGLIGDAYRRLQDRRVARWSSLMLDHAASPEKLVAMIETGLAKDDENVVAGVVGGARAAAAAVELSAVATIAVLSRRYLQQQDLPRWFYRGALEVLERVDAAELGALRCLVGEISSIRSDRCAVIADAPGEGSWRAFQYSVPDPYVTLTPFANPSRLFAYLKRAGIAFDGEGVGGITNVMVIEREVIDWLSQALAEGLG